MYLVCICFQDRNTQIHAYPHPSPSVSNIEVLDRFRSFWKSCASVPSRPASAAMSLVVHDGAITIAPPPAYVGAPLSVLCIVAFVFLFRDTIVTGVGEAAGQTVRLSWWTARKLKKILESNEEDGVRNAWHCVHCEGVCTFKVVGVYCVKQKKGHISYYLEGICTRTNKKWCRFINKGDLATAGVCVNLEPRLAAEKELPETKIDPRIKSTSSTSRFGGTMVTGFGISQAVANKMEEEWPTMGDFAAVQKKEINAWKEANKGVRNSARTLSFAATEMKKHLASQARPKASPAKKSPAKKSPAKKAT